MLVRFGAQSINGRLFERKTRTWNIFETGDARTNLRGLSPSSIGYDQGDGFFGLREVAEWYGVGMRKKKHGLCRRVGNEWWRRMITMTANDDFAVHETLRCELSGVRRFACFDAMNDEHETRARRELRHQRAHAQTLMHLTPPASTTCVVATTHDSHTSAARPSMRNGSARSRGTGAVTSMRFRVMG